MQFHSELSYADSQVVIVKVVAVVKDQKIGSALGQGQTAEEAEDNALKRIESRLRESDGIKYSQIGKNSDSLNNLDKTPDNSQPTKTNISSHSNNQIVHNEDWSNELIQLDEEINRIGWDKESESIFLNNILGFNNRNKIIDINDMHLILQLLKNVRTGESVQSFSHLSNREHLIKDSNEKLKTLKLTLDKARQLLFNNFNVYSRSDLSNKQLLMFNLILSNEKKLTT
ncbi:hypothetical protein [Prochlorococcus marinus]|uniref:Uncharacterized protein n=1 Tax=Prochlorococcus marinus (strain MIT 9211) TaxID=93059 RepID=A9BAJ5_PROM4|nr:hypothetical protein [Prochlorococcus marinus]ABX08857.1 Hypothetical protein P9211_09261 [Prochlorococcus marinus str. MIT 9211]